jgi:hypothetical protein
MPAFQEIRDLLNTTIGWEKKLKDFYDVAEYALRSPESKKAIAVLRDKLLEKLEILENIDPDKFGGDWIKYAPDYRDDELFHMDSINRESAPRDIVNHLLEYETKLKSFYETVWDRLTKRNPKELFESLVTFKEYQITEIRNLMNSKELSA